MWTATHHRPAAAGAPALRAPLGRPPDACGPSGSSRPALRGTARAPMLRAIVCGRFRRGATKGPRRKIGCSVLGRAMRPARETEKVWPAIVPTPARLRLRPPLPCGGRRGGRVLAAGVWERPATPSGCRHPLPQPAAGGKGRDKRPLAAALAPVRPAVGTLRPIPRRLSAAWGPPPRGRRRKRR